LVVQPLLDGIIITMLYTGIDVFCLYFVCRPYYGFHHKAKVFLKIYIYNALLISRYVPLAQKIARNKL